MLKLTLTYIDIYCNISFKSCHFERLYASMLRPFAATTQKTCSSTQWILTFTVFITKAVSILDANLTTSKSLLFHYCSYIKEYLTWMSFQVANNPFKLIFWPVWDRLGCLIMICESCVYNMSCFRCLFVWIKILGELCDTFVKTAKS